MANRALLRDDYIELIYDGDQTAETVEKMVGEALGLIDKYMNLEHPIRVLVDMSRLSKSTNNSRIAAMRALRTASYDCLAIVAPKAFLRALANLVIKAAGAERKTRVFMDRVKAVEWLTRVKVSKRA